MIGVGISLLGIIGIITNNREVKRDWNELTDSGKIALIEVNRN
jgi:hypothetical protein